MRYGLRARAATLGEMYERTRSAGFGAEVKRRIVLGTYVLSSGYYDAYYLKAQQVRTLIRRDFEQAFEQVDAVAVPTSPTAAFRLGERADDPLQMYLADVFTVSAPLAGLPAISVPCGFTTDRLPVGLQLTGRAWDEATLLRIADAYERATPWSRMHPDLNCESEPEPAAAARHTSGLCAQRSSSRGFVGFVVQGTRVRRRYKSPAAPIAAGTSHGAALQGS